MYDDPGDDDYNVVEYDDETGTGLLGATLRNAAIIIALGLGVAWLTGGLGSGETKPSLADGTSRGANDGRRIEFEADEDEAEPEQRAAYAPDEIVVPSGPRGHFVVEVDVNGTPVRFLIDTGATTVTLTAEDARRVGLPVYALDYNARVQTANGEVEVAPVNLRDMRLGGLEMRDVEATVTQAQLNISLLGMSFLRRLSGYEVRPEGLVLRY